MRAAEIRRRVCEEFQNNCVGITDDELNQEMDYALDITDDSYTKLDGELRRIMALSIAPRSAYRQINPPNNREWRGRCKGGSIFGRKQISPFCFVNRHFSQILCW